MSDDAPHTAMQDEANAFKALGHSTRLAIVRVLSRGEQCVHEIADRVGGEQSNVSRHLGTLEKAGLLRHRREGANVYYDLATPGVLDLLAWVEDVLSGKKKVRSASQPEESASETQRATVAKGGRTPTGEERGFAMTEKDHTAVTAEIAALAKANGNSRNGLMNVVRELQKRHGCISPPAVQEIAKALNCHRVEVEDVISFYHFLSPKPRGRYTFYLNNSITAVMAGRDEVAAAFERELGIKFGETTADGAITLVDTSCIGMNDQEPSGILNGVVFTELTPARAKDICAAMKLGEKPRDLVKHFGDGRNASEHVSAMVKNNLRQTGEVIFAPFEPGSAVREAVAMHPEEIIGVITNSRLRGRGGAGFPTGMKWQFCRKAAGAKHYVICNADEGEPGTFKDRVILTECADLLFDGMTVAAWAIGADEGVLYLRGEYEYLRRHLEAVLQRRRQEGMLGLNVAGKKGFNFDIRIQMGAGAYICGEESALIESMEGKRGAPRDRPPFPVEYGYNTMPTVVNNVETLCAAARVAVKGPGWFSTFGTDQSRGTKVLSVSGDCAKPGVYEVPFGISVKEMLELAGARNAKAVQVGGPSGNCIDASQFDRKISFEDLATGGSFIVFGPDRNILDVVRNFMDFFVEESCGWCVPCRVGNRLLAMKLDKILEGRGTASDLADLQSWGQVVKSTSRCGFGQTSPNPILTTLKSFRGDYEALIHKETDFLPEFDLSASLREASEIAGRSPEHA